jgi:hypothetical protein
VNGLIRATIALGLAAAAAPAFGGAFIFADQDALDDNAITHPHGYVGTSAPLTVTVCINPSTVDLPASGSLALFESTVQKVVNTWNAQRASTQNLGLNAENDIPADGLDLEAVILHETGHCLGLAHPNHASESGLPSPQVNGTKSEPDAAPGTPPDTIDQLPGLDGLHGSSDDERGDDVNLYWYRRNVNTPLDFPSVIDSTTFARVGFLPVGHLFAANGDRDVLNALGFPSTESVMQQGQFSDEAQRRLTGEDMATIRLAQSGVDEIQGTADDYALQLSYAGQTTSCNIPISFVPGSGLAFCSVSGTTISGQHRRITSAFINIEPGFNWYFSPGSNTTTTITADTPDPSGTGVAYNVAVTVAKTLADPPGSPTGTVEISDGAGATCNATLSGGSGNCNLTSSTAGPKTLTASYLGFRGFDASTDTETHGVGVPTTTTITSDNPDPSVVGQSYTVNVTVAGTGTPTGTVDVADGTGATCMITLASGSGSCALTSTSAGAKTLSATYVPTGGFTASSDTEAHQVNAANTTLAIASDNPEPSVVGQAVAVNFTLAVSAPGAGTPTGTVTVTVSGGAETCNATLPATSCDITLTAAGARTLTATYAATGNFNGSSDTEAHQVNAANTTTTITSDSPDASVVGQPVAVNFTVVANSPGSGTPAGTVTVTVSGGAETCNATLPTTSCNITLTATGARTLTANYGGSANFNGSNDTEAHQVNAANTTTTITGDTPDASVVGQQVAVAFTVAATAPGSGTPTGTVTVTVSGGAETCNAPLPTTSCNITLAAAGARTLTATYGGDANFNGSNDTETHQVNAASTTTTITSDTPDASVVGQAVAVNFTVAANAPGSGTPTGTVTVTVSGGSETCNATLPTATCNITLTASGARTLTATYGGDANYNGSNDTEAHQVNAAGTTLTITSDSPDASVVGQAVAVNFTLAVTGPGSGTPTGSVTVTVSGGAETCSATLPATSCNITLTASGARTLTATYAGDADFSGSSDTEAHQVNAAATTLAITGDTPDPSVVGQQVAASFSLAVTAPGAGTPTGSVTFTVSGGAETCVAALPATACNITLTSAGIRTLTATYGGDANFSTSNDTETHAVATAATTLAIASATPDPSVVGQAVAVGLTLSVNAPGAGTPSGTITVTAAGGAESCVATLPTLTCNITLTSAGSRTLTASYSGDANFGASNDTEAHAVNAAATALSISSDDPDPSVTGQVVTVSFALAVLAPGAGTPTGSVTVTASGGVETCTAVLPITACNLSLLGPGLRTLTATYSGDANFASSQDTESHSVNLGSTTTLLASDVPDPSAEGGQVLVTATVVPIAPAIGVPTGTIAITASGGSETCTITLPATSCSITLTGGGMRTLTATYSGDALFATSNDTDSHTVIGDLMLRDGFENP